MDPRDNNPMGITSGANGLNADHFSKEEAKAHIVRQAMLPYMQGFRDDATPAQRAKAYSIYTPVGADNDRGQNQYKQSESDAIIDKLNNKTSSSGKTSTSSADPTADPTSTADSAPANTSGLLRAMAYGPSQGEFTHDTLNGPLGPLKQGDLALSPDQLGQFPLGSFVHVVSPDGKTILQNQRVADYSYTSPGNPTSGSFEVWNGQDLGHAHLVAANGSSDQSGPNPDGSYTHLQDEDGNWET